MDAQITPVVILVGPDKGHSNTWGPIAGLTICFIRQQDTWISLVLLLLLLCFCATMVGSVEQNQKSACIDQECTYVQVVVYKVPESHTKSTDILVTP